MKTTAVITDATSPEFFFPRWRRYYGELFGPDNLYVVVYRGDARKFAHTDLQNIRELDSIYNDQLRAAVISDMVAELLTNYDVVIRCDVDEFIVPSAARHADLAEYVETNTFSSVTAHGINVIELADDPVLNPAELVLAQRKYGVRATALNKTCLTTRPLRWAAGFHGASAPPRFAGLYNIHLRFADLGGRIAWHEVMLSGLSSGSSEFAYFSPGAEQLTNHQKHLQSFMNIAGESEAEFDDRFLATVTHNTHHEIHQGQFFEQQSLVLLSDLISIDKARF